MGSTARYRRRFDLSHSFVVRTAAAFRREVSVPWVQPPASTHPSGLPAWGPRSAGGSDKSHSFVVRTATAFRCHPVNDLVRIHDVAGLAVDAV